ncbi:MAG: glycoside hydrolase family 3 C-terminal domain-containing protein, partial [Clostridia bacterium]|nr:glycoside hydrolase family 3 C-terminal domain-containing protein [Clostridia bacterium]
MLGINMNDVITTLGLLKNYLIGIGVVLALAIIISIIAIWVKKPFKGLLRGTSWVCFLLVTALLVNAILVGPMYSMVSMVLGKSGDISEQSITDAQELCETIADEGFVLLKNDGVLPLKTDKVNTFGWSATNPVYGGTGSGSLSGLYETVSLLKGLENAGLSYNQDLVKFYTDWRTARPNIGMMGQDWTVPERTIEEYDAAGIFDNAKSYSDTAILVLARSGGEGADLPTSLDPAVPSTFTDDGKGTMFSAMGLRYSEFPEDLDASKSYLEPTTRETALIERVTKEFSNVVVVINASNAMELGWVNDYPSIKAVILAPGPGQTGFNALGNILTGKVNPSGRTIDTFVADLTAVPAFNNIGEFQYTNLADVSPMSYGFPVTPNFVDYVEGIYVGYRWYETAAAEGAIDYDKTVVYPFGYGLSYTTFEQKMGDIKESNGEISFDVTVTNTGTVAGKDVVEVYFNPPYT